MRIIALFSVLQTMIVLSLCSIVFAAGDARVNPHSDSGDCAVCHVAPRDTLRSWFAFGSTKRELKDNTNQLCQKCHTIEPPPPDSMGGGVGHPTGKKTAINHGNLPLASDGTITCATTCHNMHVTSDDQLQQRKHLRLPPRSLCISCHDV